MALSAVTLFGACGPRDGGVPPSQLHVVKGTDLSLAEVKALGLVALVVDADRADRRGICTGTLVAPRKVLTAAHCLSNPLGAVSKAVFGTDAFAKVSGAGASPVRVDVEKTERLSGADIALVTLAADAPSGFRTQTLALAFPPAAARGVRDALGAGFGRAGTDVPLTGGFARKGTARMTGVEPGMPIVIANSGQGRGFCFGDSGGPLFADFGQGNVVVGVLSQGATTCETGLDNYASVPFHGAALTRLLSSR